MVKIGFGAFCLLGYPVGGGLPQGEEHHQVHHQDGHDGKSKGGDEEPNMKSSKVIIHDVKHADGCSCNGIAGDGYCHSPTQPQLELELDLIMGRNPPPPPHPTHTGTFKALPGNMGSSFSVCNLILTQLDEI